MKYFVVLCDGMADYPIEELDGKTPMSVAHKPHMNWLAKHGQVGMVQTVAPGLKPGSDVANLSVLGYDPTLYYSGRSPLEAASIGIALEPTDVTFRCNLVTLSGGEPYEAKTMADYCAGDISSEEAAQLIQALQPLCSNQMFSLYPGVNYRHCLVWKDGTTDLGGLTPPHDISGKTIQPYLPNHPHAKVLLQMMEQSVSILAQHPVNLNRIAKGLHPANAIWLWGEGRKKPLPSFQEKYGLKGSIISAVDLLKGIGILAGMRVPDVPGATGYIDTNFEGKAQAAIDEIENGQDFVYIHIEAPDECGHRAELQNKIRAIELIDQKILGPILNAFQGKEPFQIMVLPDHATPIAEKTHTAGPVPYLLYSSVRQQSNALVCFDEKNAAETGRFKEPGHLLLEQFLQY